MITAEEAKELSEKHIKPFVDKELKLAENGIIEACKDGEHFAIIYNNVLHSDTIRKLEFFGYKVKSWCGNTIISWPIEEDT